MFAGAADAVISRDAQLPRDDLVVRRDDYNALLFQRQIPVGLLLCHILTSLQQHTLPHRWCNSYDQNGEKSSVKCEICTKLDSDPPRDLFDFNLRKPDRSECLQDLADPKKINVWIHFISPMHKAGTVFHSGIRFPRFLTFVLLALFVATSQANGRFQTAAAGCRSTGLAPLRGSLRAAPITFRCGWTGVPL